MGKKCSVRKSLLGLLEGVCPRKSFWRTNEGIGEGAENGGSVRNKTAVEVNKAEEALELFDGSRLRVVSNSLDMRGEGCDAGGRDMMAEEGDGRLGKGTFFGINQDTVGGQDGQNVKI